MNYREVARLSGVLHPTRARNMPARRERKPRVDTAALRSSRTRSYPRGDLARRDLTINAIAQAGDGSSSTARGQRDLQARVLRHVRRRSSKIPCAYCGSRASPPASRAGISVASETMALMPPHGRARRGWRLGGGTCLAGNRKALREPAPACSSRCCATAAPEVVFPEINACSACRNRKNGTLKSIPGAHFDGAGPSVLLTADAKVRFAALVHDLGKAATPQAEWPGHKGHEGAA